MIEIHPSDLTTILQSKRANIYCLEHCRELVKGHCVTCVADVGKEPLYWNIEHRLIESLQHRVRFWFDDVLRLEAAKGLRRARLHWLRRQGTVSRPLRDAGFSADAFELDAA